MPLSLFGFRPKRRAEDEIGCKSEYLHTFGGNAREFELAFTEAPLPLHLIYRIDLRDPVLSFELPGIDFLPLLYGFHYGTVCCYQIASNREVRLIHPRNQNDQFPPWDAPESFPLQRTSFSTKDYDATKAEDVMEWKGVFGWEELSDAERDRALDLAKTKTSLTKHDGPGDDWTYEDVIRNMYDPPFAQSKPQNTCCNPECGNEKLRIVALQHNVLPLEMIWPDNFVQTIWEICDACQCVTASNQCG